ncbi:MAG: hypothetical protein JWN30_130 [Bacilli bacterium]|nr:hypothetical protein [Bacilli bacterium]
MYMTWIATAVVAYSLDGIFGGVLKLYYYLNSRIEIYDVFFQLVTVPPFGIIFLNFMPKKLLKFVVYSLVWTVISVLVEYLAVKIQLLVYNGWKPWYSPPFYFLGCVYLRWHLAFIKRGSH